MKQKIKLYLTAEVTQRWTAESGNHDTVVYDVQTYDTTEYYPQRFVIGVQEVEFDFPDQNPHKLRHQSHMKKISAIKTEFTEKLVEAERDLAEFLALENNPTKPDLKPDPEFV